MVRPRTVSLTPEEMIALGKEMVSWVEVNKPLHLSQWYTIHKGFIYNEWKSFLQVNEFLPYYEQALKLVGMQYLDKNSNIREGVSQRWQRVYFKDIKEEEDQTRRDKLEEEFEYKKKLLELESLLKAKQSETVSEEVKTAFDALMNQFIGKSALNKEERSSKSV